MSNRTGRTGLRAAAVAAAALALAGCAADYVGDDWQCPLAQGSVCASVAAADPAVPRTRGQQTLVPQTLVPAARDSAGRPGAALPSGPRTEGAASEAADARDCASECNPLAWLAGLFGAPDGGAGSGETAASGQASDDGSGHSEYLPLSMGAAKPPTPETSGVAAADAGAAEADTGSAPPPGGADAFDATVGGAVAADPDAPVADASLSAHDGSLDEGLREPGTIARVWIAPWVDAGGIYREGAWVRAVIAPSEWRLR